MPAKRKCPVCNNQFIPVHGNQVYCTIEHKKHQKAAMQQKLYGILKEFRKGFLTNYKLLEQLLIKPGDITVNVDELKNKGFQFSCYFGTFINDQKETFYRIGEYHYHIFIKNQTQFVKVLKNTL